MGTFATILSGPILSIWFLAFYADGFERFGYRSNSPLEVMAYNHQDRFKREAQPFKVEAACQALIQDLTGVGDRPASIDRS